MQAANKKHYKLVELIHDLDVTLKGDPDCLITGISMIQTSEPGHLTFLSNPLYKKYLSHTRASAVILDEESAKACPVTSIICRNPYYVYAQIAHHFANRLDSAHGIHPSAIVAEDASIHPDVSIGPQCVIGHQVKIGARVTLGPGVIVQDQVIIDEDTRIDAHVTLYQEVKIGKRTHISSGAVIGSDGFGFANHNQQWHKVPQLGRVEIGDDVDIGANTTIDRGAIGHTLISSGVKLDNLIQVGHNVQIGSDTIIAGCVAIAGSVVIGKNCMIGGGSCFAGHITIADNVVITGMTAVTKSITEAGIYSSGIVGAVPNLEFRKNNARFHRLDNLMQRVKNVESTLKQMTGKN